MTLIAPATIAMLRGREPVMLPRRQTAVMWRSVVLVGVVVSAGCGGDGGSVEPAEATLSYEFRDSSVPPEYHRSYTLELTGGDDGAHGELVVDSYGDVLHEVDVEVDQAVWEQAVGDLAALDVDESRADGCTGGTGRDVRLRAGGETVTAASIEVCGGEGEDAADELDAVIAPLLAELDMESLLATE